MHVPHLPVKILLFDELLYSKLALVQSIVIHVTHARLLHSHLQYNTNQCETHEALRVILDKTNTIKQQLSIGVAVRQMPTFTASVNNNQGKAMTKKKRSYIKSACRGVQESFLMFYVQHAVLPQDILH